MDSPFKVGGMWLKKVPHSRIPIAVGAFVVAATPVVAMAKGPIVRASPDWLAVIRTFIGSIM